MRSLAYILPVLILFSIGAVHFFSRACHFSISWMFHFLNAGARAHDIGRGANQNEENDGGYDQSVVA